MKTDDTRRMPALLSGRRLPVRRLNAIRELRGVVLKVGGVAAEETTFYWDAWSTEKIRAETAMLKNIYGPIIEMIDKEAANPSPPPKETWAAYKARRKAARLRKWP